MKLEVGNYIRNCYGRIAKIDYIEDNVAYCNNWLYREYEEHIDYINLNSKEELDEIIKVSDNIIDLIEVGDYVNGLEVYETGTFGHNGKRFCRLYGNVAPFYNIDIKSIVTHEQFEQMKYEVE